MRIVTKSKKLDPTGPLFKEIDVLPFEKLMLQSKLLFMHAVHNDYAPASFNHVFVKNNTRDVTYELRNAGAYVVPAARIEFFKKFPIYTFPTAWNNAGNLVFYNNKITFQKALKEEQMYKRLAMLLLFYSTLCGNPVPLLLSNWFSILYQSELISI